MSAHCIRCLASATPPLFIEQQLEPFVPNLACCHPPIGDSLFPVPDDPSIFIGSLPLTTTDATLTELLTQFGPLQGGGVRLLKDASGRCKGAAFADYVDMQSARYAINVLNGFSLSGRTLRANLARPDAQPSPAARGTPMLLGGQWRAPVDMRRERQRSRSRSRRRSRSISRSRSNSRSPSNARLRLSRSRSNSRLRRNRTHVARRSGDCRRSRSDSPRRHNRRRPERMSRSRDRERRPYEQWQRHSRERHHPRERILPRAPADGHPNAQSSRSGMSMHQGAHVDEYDRRPAHLSGRER